MQQTICGISLITSGDKPRFFTVLKEVNPSVERLAMRFLKMHAAFGWHQKVLRSTEKSASHSSSRCHLSTHYHCSQSQIKMRPNLTQSAKITGENVKVVSLFAQDDDVVLRHTLPVFTGLGRCPIVSWDFAGAVSIFGPDALPVVHQWPLPGLEPATSRVIVAAHNH